MRNNLCLCGCGQPPKPGKTWLKGHHRRGVGGFGHTHNTRPLPPPQNHCACGCGTLVRKTFARGHWLRTKATNPQIRQRREDRATTNVISKTVDAEIPRNPASRPHMVVRGNLTGIAAMQDAPVRWDDPYALVEPDEGSMALIKEDLRRAGYVNVSYHPHRDPFPVAEAIEIMIEHESRKLEGLSESELREYSRTLNKRILHKTARNKAA